MEWKKDGLCVTQRWSRRPLMKEPDDVAAMLRLHELGWGSRRIAAELGVSRNTVKRYLREGGWKPYQVPKRERALDGLEGWLKATFLQHRGNADVVRQELLRVHGKDVHLRTVQRAVEPFRQLLRAEAAATVRFETPPGRQLQIDFGTATVTIGGERVKAKLFVATLGFSRRMVVQAFRHERQSAWMTGLETAFRTFGRPEEVLLDNPRALVDKHDMQTREVVFNSRFLAFCRYWEVTPRACAPYRARTKGKDERAVGYVKRNAIAGHAFDSWEALEAHLARWVRDVADQRLHGTTGEAPAVRFERESEHLRDVDGKPPFRQVRELRRRVQSDCVVEVDTNRYSVPWRLLGRTVSVVVSDGVVTVLHDGGVVATHTEAAGRRQLVRERQHFGGLVGGPVATPQPVPAQAPARPPELLRPLSAYEKAAGGGW